MTARQIYEGILIELNKKNAPSLLLEDYVYMLNKSIYQYINKQYNIYDINEQSTDNLRVLKATAILEPTITNLYPRDEGTGDLSSTHSIISSLFGATYEIYLPSDYFHILNCICNFKVNKKFKCYPAGSYVQFGATRTTSDMFSQIINNAYLKPSYKRPYYFINNVNTSINLPTNSYNQTTGLGTDMNGVYKVTSETGTTGDNLNLSRKIKISGVDRSVVEKDTATRYGNASPVRMEIRYGKDNSIFELTSLYIDYIKTPQYINLTSEQIDLTEDTSQIMEFPDYVCQEIINELVKLVLENSSDPRLQTFIPVTQTIANPTQQESPNNKK